MDTKDLATAPQCQYVRALLKTRVVPSEAASPLRLVLEAGTLEKVAAPVAIHYLLQQPYRPRYRVSASQSRSERSLPCETDV